MSDRLVQSQVTARRGRDRLCTRAAKEPRGHRRAVTWSNGPWAQSLARLGLSLIPEKQSRVLAPMRLRQLLHTVLGTALPGGYDQGGCPMRNTKKRRRRLVRVLVGIALLAGACSDSGGGDKAGGAAEIEPHVLTIAQANHQPPDQLVSWAEEVRERSGGTLTIKFENSWRMGQADYESSTIDDVRDGKVDIAWVGARVFDRVG